MAWPNLVFGLADTGRLIHAEARRHDGTASIDRYAAEL